MKTSLIKGSANLSGSAGRYEFSDIPVEELITYRFNVKLVKSILNLL